MLDASECGPTFNTDRVLGVIAGGQVAVSTASESAEDDAAAGGRALAELQLTDVGRGRRHQRQRSHAVRARRDRVRPRTRAR